ncbi:MAG: tRNA (adenosine(37)-N6)-threonylcarbamoyltransferase complex dimerization subunit type 1 TsaB [Clostridiales bacterium]|nr:tRNA (adenosine(37)-N6)-threonylcarbamoyltransferase complex dimerization subunit type 1 TsaB [Clostridiales bacterium]
MKILALDSSGLVASVAILTEDSLLAEYTVNYKKTHSQTLLPMLDEIVKMIEIDLHDIDAIAVAKGPGSFTGLRIGSATAKGLGLALDKPLIGIPTVDGLAYNLYGCSSVICPLMDARRNQVYTGLYKFEQSEMKTIESQQVVDVTEIVDKINNCGKPVVYLGDGVDCYKKQLEELTKVPFQFAPSHLNKQRAAAVGALAIEYYKKGWMETATQHQPEYLRLSQAERERREATKEK